MEQYIGKMIGAVREILGDDLSSVYLFGSCVYNDFKPSWSDIDVLFLTFRSMTKDEAYELVNLRQKLSSKNHKTDYMRLFEGGILSEDAFLNEKSDTVVYWGTSGERVTDRFVLNPISMVGFLDSAKLLYGKEIRGKIERPDEEKVRSAIFTHYKMIMKYGLIPSISIYSAGFMLDIARCLYTLETGKIISKTLAGSYSLEKGLVPDPEIMEKVLEIRNNPDVYKNDDKVKKFLSELAPYIERFARVLGNELKKYGYEI